MLGVARNAHQRQGLETKMVKRAFFENARLGLLQEALAGEISAEISATLQENNNVVEGLDRYLCHPSMSNTASTL